MRPFKSNKEATRYAERLTPAGKWVNVSVIILDRRVTLRTRVINGGHGLATMPMYLKADYDEEGRAVYA